ncbi:MAG: hypothetical protein KF862_08060 [Chitinophagaceae bacterium]|nr:hypothetical protein [Chitinophagaceae bacterium]
MEKYFVNLRKTISGLNAYYFLEDEDEADVVLDVAFKSGVKFVSEKVQAGYVYREDKTRKDAKGKNVIEKRDTKFLEVEFTDPAGVMNFRKKNGDIIFRQDVGGKTKKLYFGDGSLNDHYGKDYFNEGDLRTAWYAFKDTAKSYQEILFFESFRVHEPLLEYFPIKHIISVGMSKVTKAKKENYDDYNEAVDHFKNAMSFMKTDSLVRINKILQPNYDKRTSELNKAVSIWEGMLSEPQGKDTRMNQDVINNVLCNLACAYLWLNNFEKAKEYIAKRRQFKGEKQHIQVIANQIDYVEKRYEVNKWRPLLKEDTNPFVYGKSNNEKKRYKLLSNYVVKFTKGGFKMNFEYDKKNSLIRTYITDEYDLNGKKISDSKMEMNWRYSYNNKGAILKRILCRDASCSIQSAVFEYSWNFDSTKLTESAYEVEGGKKVLSGTKIYTFNSKKQLIQEEWSNGDQYRFEYENNNFKNFYFKPKNKKEELLSTHGKYDNKINPYYTHKYSFWDNAAARSGVNNAILIFDHPTLSSPDKTTTTVEYIYDENGYPVKYISTTKDTKGSISKTEVSFKYIYQ